jgi:hypothetical protein
VVVAGAVLFLHSNLDSIVKAAIEKYGTAAAQSEVRLDSVKLSVTSGEGALTGLSVGNPKGFTSPKVLSMGVVSVKLDTASITGNGPVIIKEIIIDKPDVHFEATNTGSTNLQALEKNLMASSHAPAASPAAGGNAVKQGEGRKIIITDLYIRNGQVDISHPMLKQPLTAPLPPIHLANIGKDNGGATPAQVAEQVLASITSSAGRVAGDSLSKNLGGQFKNAVGGNAGAVGDRLKGLLR